mmetsp:Transcript_85773/g.165128  ORF Transcript_85773/g.165128 Transcript_85773/m.165128 type:complete len:223 (-) Transcript_85773:190-858(-)
MLSVEFAQLPTLAMAFSTDLIISGVRRQNASTDFFDQCLPSPAWYEGQGPPTEVVEKDKSERTTDEICLSTNCWPLNVSISLPLRITASWGAVALPTAVAKPMKSRRASRSKSGWSGNLSMKDFNAGSFTSCSSHAETGVLGQANRPESRRARSPMPCARAWHSVENKLLPRVMLKFSNIVDITFSEQEESLLHVLHVAIAVSMELFFTNDFHEVTHAWKDS